MQLRLRRFVPVVHLVMISSIFLVGCSLRKLEENDVLRKYEARTNWGKSTLILHADHTFEQTVARNNLPGVSARGTWELIPFAEKESSSAILAFKPFLAISHDQKGNLDGGAAISVTRGLLTGIVIAADPDWGVAYEKE